MFFKWNYFTCHIVCSLKYFCFTYKNLLIMTGAHNVFTLQSLILLSLLSLIVVYIVYIRIKRKQAEDINCHLNEKRIYVS